MVYSISSIVAQNQCLIARYENLGLYGEGIYFIDVGPTRVAPLRIRVRRAEEFEFLVFNS